MAVSVEKVIREKRARAFLVSEEHSHDPLLLALFDARVLHVVRRGYSAQDRPGSTHLHRQGAGHCRDGSGS
jgi:hypothetical protein